MDVAIPTDFLQIKPQGLLLLSEAYVCCHTDHAGFAA
jgi:hypothetical protein